MPLMHEPVEHTTPHLPQLFGFVLTLTHSPPAHLLLPGLQTRAWKQLVQDLV